MIPHKTVDEIINKHSVLEKQLASGDIDKKSFAEKSKEYSILNEIVEDAKNYLLYEKNKLELEKIITDEGSVKELKEMAEVELVDLNSQHQKSENHYP